MICIHTILKTLQSCVRPKELTNIQHELATQQRRPQVHLNSFDFSELKIYEDVCDYYLFDTKGELPGGNGFSFDWEVLKNYPSQKPFFLSGGIGMNELDKLKKFKLTDASKYCHAIDVNSKFEIEAGLKNYNELEKFKHELQH